MSKTAYRRPNGTSEKAPEAGVRRIEPISPDFPAMIHCTDRHGTIVSVTDLWLERLGYAREEVVGRRSVDFLAPESRRIAEEINLPEFARTGHVTGVHYQFIHQSGELVDMALSATAQRDSAGSILRSVAVLVDVTEALRAQARARAAEQRYAQLFNAVTDYVYTVRVENGCAVWTKHGVGCERVTGFTPEEYEGDPFLWYRMVHEVDRDAVLQLGRAVMSGEQPAPLEHRIWHKDGRLRWIRSVLVPHVDDAGHLTSYDGVITDISERKEVEEALHAQEARFRSLIENATDFIAVLSGDGRFTYQSPSVERGLGYPHEALQGKYLLEFVEPDDMGRVRDALDSLRAAAGSTASFESRFRHSDGAWVHLDSVAKNLLDAPYVHGIVLISRDITDRKRADAERQMLEAQLYQAQKMEAVGQLAGGVAHSFNNLLTGILGNLGLAREESEGTPLADYLQQAEQASLRASDLVHQMLAFSRKSQALMQAENVDKIVREAVGIVRNSVDHWIEICEELEPDLPSVRSNHSQLQQVLLNLCINARDAIEARQAIDPSAPRRISVAARHVTGPDGSALVRLSVADTGTGMDEEVRARLFEPFFTTKALGKGTGLGLATAYGLVKQHGGWIECESQLGSGSVFHVYLPTASGATREAEGVREAPQIPRGTETVLLVDDEAVVRTFAGRVLERLGYQVLYAADGQEGLDVFARERERVGLVLLDLSMPNLSGREVLQRIRAMEPDAKIVISSGYSEEGISDLVGDLGASGYIAKPYQMNELAHILREVLDSR